LTIFAGAGWMVANLMVTGSVAPELTTENTMAKVTATKNSLFIFLPPYI
jgi:hypothetical protein